MSSFAGISIASAALPRAVFFPSCFSFLFFFSSSYVRRFRRIPFGVFVTTPRRFRRILCGVFVATPRISCGVSDATQSVGCGPSRLTDPFQETDLFQDRQSPFDGPAFATKHLGQSFNSGMTGPAVSSF